MSAPRCYVIDVDGEPASVRLSKPPEQVDPAELDAVCDVVRDTRRLIEAMHERGLHAARDVINSRRPR